MLRRNAQRGSVLHQAYVVNVGHLGTADALVNPAHDIAQYTLRVVFQLLSYILVRPVMANGGDGNGQQRGQPRRSFLGKFRLAGEDVALMIMHRVQRCCGG